ncbi:MAG: hypothetical protein V1859_09205 [archaeon]
MKCAVCKNKIEETFLKKIIGAYIKDSKGKKHPVCAGCQAKLNNSKEKMLGMI